jgi:hypothetical protein
MHSITLEYKLNTCKKYGLHSTDSEYGLVERYFEQVSDLLNRQLFLK